MRKIFCVVGILFCFVHHSYGQQLYINEFMASNSQTIADGTGNFSDWFEVYNPNGFAVNLAGYYATDKSDNPTKFQFPTGSAQTIVPANGFLLVWASGEPSRGGNHVGFSLSSGGEHIGLYRTAGGSITVVDSLSFGPQRTDISQGRKPNGTGPLLYFQKSTNDTSPGASNNGKNGFTESLPGPTFSQNGGFYQNSFTLTLTSPNPTATIYYTLDGSDPNPTNPNAVSFSYKNSYPQNPGQAFGPFLTETFKTNTYSAPLSITDRSSSPNRVSIKSSTWNFTPEYFPDSPIFKGTVVRAVAYKSGSLASDIVTHTYFVTPSTSRYAIPVISIATTEKNLFDYNTGIYTAGDEFENYRMEDPNFVSNDCTTGNFFRGGDESERPANVEFFLNNQSIINQAIGLRIHGGCSRSFPRKSLRLYSSSNFEYPFFNNLPPSLFYNRLILRSGGNDWAYSVIIDAYMQALVQNLRFETQSSRPAVAFINGEYWGIHNITERYDKYYFDRNYGIETDSLDIISARYGFTADEGTVDNHTALFNYFSNNNPVDYTYAKTKIDVENLADYEITEIFAANTDWPSNNQVNWRKRTANYEPNAPYGQDGRWRWLLKDMDYSLGFLSSSITDPTLNRATENNEYTLFFRRLLDIPEFKSYFISRSADLLNTTFLPTRTVAVLDTFKTAYQPYMPENYDRWTSQNTFTGWLNNINTIADFMQQRPANVRSQIRSKFGLPGERNLTVNVSDTLRGYVKVNTINIRPSTVGVSANPYPWTGIYFQNNPVRVVAKAKTGYIFQHWLEGSTIVSTDTAYSFNPNANRSLVAVFNLGATIVARPPAFTLSSCEYRFETWAPTATPGTYPANMSFVNMNAESPTLSASPADSVSGAYDLSSKTRINGLDSDGISFINTGSANPGYVENSLGGAILALNTTSLTEASVQWTGGTVTANPREYNIRLRYRLGTSGSFTDLTDGAGNPVEYVRNATNGHSQVIGPVALPAVLLDKPYVQLLWQYYYTGTVTSGSRDQLRLDDIIVRRGNCESLASGNWTNAATWSCGRVPTSCDPVVIKAGHVITLGAASAVAKRVQFETNAKLQYTASSAQLSIAGGN